MTAGFLLDAYGVGVKVTAESDEFGSLVANLEEDFRYFKVAALPRSPEISIHLTAATPKPSSALPVFRTRMCQVRGLGRHRICDYGNGLRIDAVNSRRHRHFTVFAPAQDPRVVETFNETYEVTYTTLLSAIGEALDLRGFHRIHALGIEKDGQGMLYVLPSGGGKSSLCAKLLSDRTVRILSDEMPLLKGGRVFPFPLRIALKPEDARILLPGVRGRAFPRRLFGTKELFPIPVDRVSGPVILSQIILPEAGLFPLFRSLVVGEGLAQMSEQMLRLNSVHHLVRIAISRLAAWIRLPRSRNTFRRDQTSIKTLS